MTCTLLLKFAAPWQSWGNDSRYTVRSTELEPTKSGVIGFLAAAEGRYRGDDISDLVNLRFGVRVDQPGTVEVDFQTANDHRSGKSWPLTRRYYLADSVFLVGVEGDRKLLEGLVAAISAPAFPLYLGRRSCPVNHDCVIGIVEHNLTSALQDHRWLAADWHRRTRPPTVSLRIVRDAEPGEISRSAKDVPTSFSSERRSYSWRRIVSDTASNIDNPIGTGNADDFFEVVRSG